MYSRMGKLVISCLVLVSLFVGMVPWAGAETSGSADRIEKTLLAKALTNPSARFNVIINMRPGKLKDAKEVIEDAGGKVERQLPIVGGVSARLPGHGVIGLARNPRVYRIFEDSPMLVMDTPTNTVGTLAVRAPEVWSLGYTGKGVGVAVLDSGVAPHNDLTASTLRIIATVDLIDGTVGMNDLGGHGTHVAGIIAGDGYSGLGMYQGIAPQAYIISVKVTDNAGLASYSSVIDGIQWVVRNKKNYNIRVMNISLGAPVTRSYYDDPLIAAMEVAWFSGVVVVTAAGNNGPGPGTVTSPGNDPYAITVGALDDVGTTDRSDDVIADFSSRGPTNLDRFNKPDLVAPGRRVVSLRSIGSYLDLLFRDRSVDGAYFRLSGTSMASPVVAGVVALLLQKDPTLTPNHVKQILTQTAMPMKYDTNTVGSGAVDALAAVNYTGRTIANRRLTPNGIVARLIYPLVRGAPLLWRDPYYKGRNWSNYTWETLPWDNYTWENFSWESIDWASPTWSNYTWENFTWENYTWENYTWENYTWEKTGGEHKGDDSDD